MYNNEAKGPKSVQNLFIRVLKKCKQFEIFTCPKIFLLYSIPAFLDIWP